MSKNKEFVSFTISINDLIAPPKYPITDKRIEIVLDKNEGRHALTRILIGYVSSKNPIHPNNPNYFLGNKEQGPFLDFCDKYPTNTIQYKGKHYLYIVKKFRKDGILYLKIFWYYYYDKNGNPNFPRIAYVDEDVHMDAIIAYLNSKKKSSPL